MFPSVTSPRCCPPLAQAFCLALVSLLPILPLAAQRKYPGTSTAAAHSIYNTAEPMFGAMPLVAPVFLQTDQIDSSITVVNSITFAVNGTVTLRDQGGTVIAHQLISFPSHSSTSIAVKTLLATAGSQAHSGSVTLEQDAALKGPALLAQLSMTLHNGSQPVFLEEEFGMPTAHGSTVLQGVASQTRNLPLIAITSVSDAAQTIHASCVGENTASSAIDLPAFGTAVVQACSWQAVHDTALNFGSSLLNSSTSVVTDHALSLKSDSVPGAFYAFGLALNGGLDQPQLQPVDFYDPGLLPTSAISYVGVPIGATNLLQTALSAPVLTLANFSGQPRQAAVTWADSSSGTPKVQQIANLTLAPYSSQTAALSTPGGSGFLNTFTIASNGQPGDVQAHLFTRLGTSQARTELLAKDAHDDHNGGDHPWSTSNGNSSTLLLFNSAKTPMLFHVRISGGGNTWVESYKLAPSETRSISIDGILANGTADHNHHSLPKSLTQGEVQWNTEFGGNGLGRLVVTNTSTAMARSFSCPTYINMCSAQFGPENFEDLLLEGDPVDLSAIQPVFCTEYCPNCCGQTSPVGSSYGYSFTTSWSGGNSGTTSQVSSSNTDIYLKGISLGQFYITGQTQGGSCQVTTQGGGTVVNITTSPSAISMSSGDTSVNITVNVNPSSSASSASFALGLQNNPNSSSTATVGFNPPSSFTGNDNWTVNVSGSNSPSGIFQAKACLGNTCSNSPTIITIPPQLLIQVLYGEGHGQAAAGDSVTEPAIASSITQRLNNPSFGSPSTWQAAIVPGQFTGSINTSITNGSQPELGIAVQAYNGSLQDTTSASPCFFSPDAAGFAAIQSAYNANATTVPQVNHDPNCYGSYRQLVWKTSIGNNVSTGSGAPAFIFERQKIGNSAVVQIP